MAIVLIVLRGSEVSGGNDDDILPRLSSWIEVIGGLEFDSHRLTVAILVVELVLWCIVAVLFAVAITLERRKATMSTAPSVVFAAEKNEHETVTHDPPQAPHSPRSSQQLQPDSQVATQPASSNNNDDDDDDANQLPLNADGSHALADEPGLVRRVELLDFPPLPPPAAAALPPGSTLPPTHPFFFPAAASFVRRRSASFAPRRRFARVVPQKKQEALAAQRDFFLSSTDTTRPPKCRVLSADDDTSRTSYFYFRPPTPSLLPRTRTRVSIDTDGDELDGAYASDTSPSAIRQHDAHLHPLSPGSLSISPLT